MSFAPHEIARLLARPGPQSGIVAAIDGSRVRVATSAGAVIAEASSERLAVGERVTITAGRAVRARAAVKSYSV